MDASISDSALSRTRCSDVSEKRRKILASTFGRFHLWKSFESGPVSLKVNRNRLKKKKKKVIKLSIKRYRRGLETFPQAKTSKSGREYFSSFFRHVRATSRYQRQVENTRVHFWTFLPVSVNAQNRRAKNYF